MKTALGIMKSAGVDFEKQLEIFKKTGFDGFFSEYGVADTGEMRTAADKLGLIYQSIHAPFVRMNHMWYESEETESAKQELKDCVSDAAKYNVPIVVMHPFIGFGVNEANDFGVKNFKEVAEFAKERGIKIAFENVEGEAYLKALMDEFENYDNVGFCWDAGHEMCYNRFKDMLELYGDRLIATHINDNVGVTGDEITFLDDLHLVPFDGVKDWQDAMDRLDKCGYKDIMTFELKIDSGIDEKFGTEYSEMDFEDYVKYVYDRVQRLVGMRGGSL